jgi:hypothetical protein
MKIVLAITMIFSVILTILLPEQNEVLKGNGTRGNYLTQRALMCIQCHSPREKDGTLISSQLFLGAPIPVTPPVWGKDWALKAPRIAGMPGYDEDAAAKLLVQGIARSGASPKRPMPPFRLEKSDAYDIYLFLKSLR